MLTMLGAITRRGLVSDSAIYLFSSVAAAAIPFALLPILTRYLSPAEYGEIAMFQTLLSALAAFVGLSAVGAAARRYFDGPNGEGTFQEYVGSCFLVLVASSIIVFIVVFLARGRISELIGLSARWVLLAIVVSAATFVIQMRMNLWQVKSNVIQYGQLQVGQSLGSMALSLLLVVGLLQGAPGRILAHVYVALCFAGISFYLLRRDGLLSLTWRTDQVKAILSFGVPLVPHVFGIFLLGSFDRFVVSSRLGLWEAGVYMVAVQLTSTMGIVFDAVNKAYVPWLYERLQRDLVAEKRHIVRGTYVYFVAVLTLAGVAFWIGPYITALMAGEPYADAGKVVGWLALGQAFAGMYLMVTNYVFYAKNTALLSLASIVSGLLHIGFLLAFVSALGLIGAAMAYATSMAFRFFLTWLIAQKSHPMPWNQFTTCFGRV